MSGKKVLIVDDSNTIRRQVRLALAHAGFTVLEGVDGMDGLKKLRENNDIAMVISDVNMPRMNGIEMIESIARENLRPDVPIVMLTTEGNPTLIRKAKAAGARGWVVKPFKPERLVTAVKRLIA